ncbi:putative Serine/threonine-protein kinase AtPK2/AtPK19 [Cocos nucifera]|uniref:non-specific serine/threonine protein kinase n=1 Tax=Cocos nucifera TaxID=13894 RepID=A0A8K0I6K2_COCNU|nr:putative Serine/threonine-protein kinase AtPK2/AtPK19 [Cocos nucifera]
MVSSQISGLTRTHVDKSFKRQILLPMGPPDIVPSENMEFDFSDVFGPAPVQASIRVNKQTSENSLPASDSIEEVYDDPMVICKRSHSLVGPTARVNQSLQLSKLTLHETENSLELIESASAETGDREPSICSVEKHDAISEKSEGVGLDDFEVMKVVGQGAFGKVFQVKKKGTSEIYAMKVMRKDKIMEKNHAEYMKAERDILTKIDHPFIVQLRYSFQAMLTDFGLAKQFDERTRSNSMCGTVEYMAPEIVLGKGHDKAADWWSVGILLFEMLTGKPPFVSGNREKVQQKIVKDKIKLPAYLSNEAHSLLKGLLQKEASKRLGGGPRGSSEIKNHKWFKSINWRKLEAREVQPSFRPNVAGKNCVANFEERWTSMPLLDSPVASPVAGDSNFAGFTENLACIYTAEIVSAVSHLHANGIMHRDLKPENILLDADGHAMLTDFGLAKQFDERTRSNSMCGTVEYMAPEIVLGKGHDKAADWWSVGILLFEMLTGKPPFVSGNREKVQQKIVKDKIKLPAYLSNEAHSLLKGLLQKEASKRLGGGPRGSSEIKNHKWFKSINWRKLEAREVQPSFRPNVAGKNCVANFEERWTSMPLLDSPVASPVAGDSNFAGFTYVRPAPFLQKPSPLG